MRKTVYPGTPSLLHIYYPYTDHLGSVNTLLENGANGLTIVHEQAFDPWGRRRNVYNWVADDNAVPPANIARWLRGFTGHEHLDAFALVNMNARLYDPKLGRMLSVDNFVSVPESAMGYNRYSYAHNNPLKYTDPSGNFLAAWFLYFTETGYDIQKWISPFAFHIDVSSGTHKSGVGIEFSVGSPQISPIGFRYHYGTANYSKNYEITPGRETKEGWEVNIGAGFSFGQTHYDSPGEEFDQTIGHSKFGIPGFNLKYANDYFFILPVGDGGDRFRTAALKLQVGPFSAGMNLFTGDPGIGDDQNISGSGKGRTYESNGRTNPDKHRVGAIYFGVGPFRIGRDSEANRDFIQNKLVHDRISCSPHFRVLDKEPKWYFQFWGGSGLW